MRRSLAMLLVVGLLVAAAPAPKPTDKLQGSWRVISFETAGKSDKSHSAADSRLAVDKDTLTFTERGQVVFAGTFKLDPPHRAIDVTLTQGPDAGRELRGIYEFDGDTLRCCLARPDQKERPTRFWTWRTTHLLVTAKKEN